MRYTLRQHRTDSASISAKPHGRNYAVLPSISFVFLRVIGACRGIAAMAGPVGMEKLPSGAVEPLVGVRAEVIPLRLKQIRGQAVGGIAVEVRKRRRHCGRGHAVLHGCCRDLPPRREQRLHRALEIRVEQEVAKVGILVIRVLDLPEEHGTDDLTKWKAVQEYLSGHGSLESVCEKYEIRSTSQLRSWIKVYHAHGDFNSVKFSGGGSYMKQGRSTTQEERVQIVKDCLASGKNYGEMALKYKVSYQQVRTWTLRFEEMGEAGLEDRRGKRKKDQVPRTELEKAQIEIEQLKHKLYLAEMERDLLKKLDEIERRDAFRK